MNIKPGNNIEVTLAWPSFVGKAVGVFEAIIEKEKENGEHLEIRVIEMQRVCASNPKVNGEIKQEYIEKEVTAFKSKTIIIPRVCAMGVPMYITNPCEYHMPNVDNV